MELLINIDGKTKSIEISEEQTILEQIDHLDIPYSCLEGHCGTCVCRLVSGEVDMQDSLALTDKEVENGYILTCQSYAKTDVEIEFI